MASVPSGATAQLAKMTNYFEKSAMEMDVSHFIQYH